MSSWQESTAENSVAQKVTEKERDKNIPAQCIYIPYSCLCREKYLKKTAVEYEVSWLCLLASWLACGVNLESGYRSSQCILNFAFWDTTVVRVEHHNGLEFFIDKMARLHSDIYMLQRKAFSISAHTDRSKTFHLKKSNKRGGHAFSKGQIYTVKVVWLPPAALLYTANFLYHTSNYKPDTVQNWLPWITLPTQKHHYVPQNTIDKLVTSSGKTRSHGADFT